MDPRPPIDAVHANDATTRADAAEPHAQEAARRAGRAAEPVATPAADPVAIDPAMTAELQSMRGVLASNPQAEADAVREAVRREDGSDSRAEQARAEQTIKVVGRAADNRARDAQRAGAEPGDPTEQFAVHDAAMHRSSMARAIERSETERHAREQAQRSAAVPGTGAQQPSDRTEHLSGAQGVAGRGGGRVAPPADGPDIDLRDGDIDGVEGSPTVVPRAPGGTGTGTGDGSGTGHGRS